MSILFTLASRYLAGRKLRTFLTTLAIVFGVLVIFGMNTFLPAFVQTFTSSTMAAIGQVDATVTNVAGEAFPIEALVRLKSVPGVSNATGMLERPIGVPADFFDQDPAVPDRITAVTLVGIDPPAYNSLNAINIIAGRYLTQDDRSAAVISESLADAVGVKVGDSLSLPTATGLADLTIVGLLPQRLLPGNEEVLVNLPDAQALLDMPGKVNVLDANFDSIEEERRAEIEEAIRTTLGSTFTIGVLQAGSELLTNVKTAQMIISLFGVLALAMGGFIIFNTFRTIVAERRRDIGMLRAIGASRRTITWLILIEGLIQGFLGTVAGMILGYLFGLLLLTIISPMIKQFFNVQIGLPGVTPGLVIGTIIIGVGITVLAGLIPARAASRVPPLEALRPTLGAISLKKLAGVGFWSGLVMIVIAVAALLSDNAGLIGLGALLITIGLILVAPALVTPISRGFGSLLALLFARQGTAQLAEGNLSRQPTRAAITASTTLIALAVLVMAATVLSSISLTFINMLEKSLSGDFLLTPPSLAVWGVNTGASPELAEELRTIDGMQVVSSLRYAGTQINGVAVGLLGIVPADYIQTSGLSFMDGDAQSAYQAMAEGRNMIVNGVLSSSAGVKLGDTVDLPTPNGVVPYKVVAIASDYLNAKTTTAYISQDNIAKDFGRTEDVFYQMNVVEGADKAAVKAAINDTIAQYPQFKLIAGADYVAQNRELFDSIFLAFYAMMIFLAIPSLIAMVNTLAIGVIERTREIGTLRAVGATRRQVRTVILAEALILAAIGTGFGLLAGLYMGRMAVTTFAAVGFPVDYIFPLSGVIAAAAAGLLFGAIAAVIPARQAAGMNVVEALRFE
jgi:putative ABC transport system permease protein